MLSRISEISLFTKVNTEKSGTREEKATKKRLCGKKRPGRSKATQLATLN